MAQTDKGEITLIESGTLRDEGSSYKHQLTVTVKYEVNSTLQLMSYTVILNEDVVKEVRDIKYSYEELHLAAATAVFRKMYYVLPDLKLYF